MTEIKTMSELNNIGYSNLFLFSLATFLLIIYFGYLCFSTELPSRNWRTLTNLIYFIGVILILAFTTFEVYNTKCNNSTRYNMIDIFMAAFMPFIFVFLFGILLLTTYPGWIRGFSNTFGLSVLSLLSYKTFLQTKILSTNNSQDQASYNKLYEDPIPLFNELEPDFDETGDGNWPSYERIKKMLKNLNINITDNETHINELKQKIQRIKPSTIGQASRISGITPAALNILLIHIKKNDIQENLC